MKKFAYLRKPLMLAAATVLAATAAAQSAPQPGPQKKGNWGAMVTQTEGGHLIGNPEAKGKLVEYMSYTCSHCAAFARTGDGAIKLLYVPTGKVSYEIRHLIRDPVDLTAALAAQCGDPIKFPGNHEALILKHDEWMAKAKKVTQAQKARWSFGSFGSRAQAIASDLDFYQIMERRGYSRTSLDQCLTDEAKAQSIAEQSQADIEAHSLIGTPTFIMGGKRLDAHDWAGLQPHLDKFFR
ncbi:thioredoxin domain-containing protein [Erythrobacter vulgaris]|uniref:Thioredoxin domain-containing protein n=1 Tax=Qipengyuania vulgaris TaxID=291985 RepID=A0A844XPJ4_9SPHN|nr:thioredoxin domain-containing protein [Qipengyuania vulgaris]MXO46958.1 thioredoxin domain-containing protein [Qipengyuania vulgaris]